MSRPAFECTVFAPLQDPKRKKALKELDFDWGDDSLYLYFQWPEVLVAFYSVIVSVVEVFYLSRKTANHALSVIVLSFVCFACDLTVLDVV